MNDDVASVLERVAEGAALTETLVAVCAVVEQRVDDARAAVRVIESDGTVIEISSGVELPSQSDAPAAPLEIGLRARDDGDELGTLVVFVGRPLTDDEVPSVDRAATLAALAIARTRAQEALQVRAAQQEAVARLAEEGLGGAELADLFDSAVAAVGSMLDARAVAVLERVPATGRAIVRAAYGAADAGSVTGAPAVPGDQARSVSVEIGGVPPFGTLDVDLADDRRLSHEDRHFITSVAKLLAAAVVRDRADAAARHQALHDSVTGLPHRALFADRIAHALTRVSQSGGVVAVMFVNLDDFKLLTDSHGAGAGNGVLAEVAQRVSAAVGAHGTIARLGPDTFGVLCEDLAATEDVDVVADAIGHALEAPVAVDALELYVTASIGISLSAAGEHDPEVLLRDADAALHRARQAGRGQRERFREDMRAEAIERLETQNALRRALDRGEFQVWYQPEIALEDDRLAGFEALARWEHPQLGVVSPQSFIPLAEETGLIVPIGEWVLEEACRNLHEWQKAHPDAEPLQVSVNLSTRQLAQDGLADLTRSLLDRYDLEPASLWIEIRETTLMADADAALAALQRLREIGIIIGVDDFGTGYSSLSYLKRFPVDFLKVDRSFVSGLGRNPDDEAIVAAVVAMARNLGLAAVAEGVETAEQRAALRKLGCDMAQGYLWSPAMPPGDTLKWLDERLRTEAASPTRRTTKALPARAQLDRRRARPRRPTVEGEEDAATVVNDTTRGLLRVTNREEAVGLLISAIRRMGGRVAPARLRDPRALPFDVSLGVGEPIQPVVDPGSPARSRLERHLAELIDDARHAVDHLGPTEKAPSEVETDPTTGLLTRRAAGRALTRLATGSTVGLLEVDGLDELRQSNASAADAVLLALSRLLREHVRPSDRCGRFAGDQVLLLLPGTEPAEAAGTLERTRRLWRRVRPHPVTFSAGVAEVADRGPQFALVAADQALVAARAGGGDRVETASAPT